MTYHKIESEVSKFSALANNWWDLSGPSSPLHMFNELRLQYILSILGSNFKNNNNLKIIDIGCGGGILCESLFFNGFQDVLGVDPSSELIAAAKNRSLESGSKIRYKEDDISTINETFDLVVCSEVLEHVKDPDLLVKKAFSRLNENGLLVISTINKTAASFFECIFAPEYIMNIIPKGTHNWKMFIDPYFLVRRIDKNKFKIHSMQGVGYDLLQKRVFLRESIRSNYFLSIKKTKNV